jgi:hypothetical protein
MVRQYRTRNGTVLKGSLGHLVDSQPYLIRQVVRIEHHGTDVWHPFPWIELHANCGHSREHFSGPVPLSYRCYQCGREARRAATAQ